MEECIFCKIAMGETSSEKVFESDDFIVIKDANPKVEGHLLVIPKKHYRDFLDMPPELYEKLLMTARETVDKIGVKEFNLIMNNGKFAGQVIDHAHLHILPRKEDDGFRI
ncbi:HIT family protein [archaeon]|jgi:histidine triad (HIT) family protein|nr:HIT family protein [archaeon]MBT3577678.1 HIT family protein [archaeon]MBT6820055.1 HIT family protein [archaeon]MBT6956192.1 HIT family protein [archaeon]MBT7025343.1 HIT family protein [archaeon]